MKKKIMEDKEFWRQRQKRETRMEWSREISFVRDSGRPDGPVATSSVPPCFTAMTVRWLPLGSSNLTEAEPTKELKELNPDFLAVEC